MNGSLMNEQVNSMTLQSKVTVRVIILFIIALPFTALAQTTTPPLPTATPRIALYGPLDYGDFVTGSLNEDVPAAIYTFEGRAGERVTITLTSADFTAYVVLRAADQQELATAEDSPANQNARIEGFVLPVDGTYIIRAGAFGGGVKGAYELRLELAVPANNCHNHSHHSH